MELTLHTEGWYDASHSLEDYDGKCANKHGHTYLVRVWVKGEESQLNKSGILWDFGNLKKIISQFDHTDLNELFNEVQGINSTAENQAMFIYNRLKEIDPDLKFKIRLYEQIAPKRSYCECGDF